MQRTWTITATALIATLLLAGTAVLAQEDDDGLSAGIPIGDEGSLTVAIDEVPQQFPDTPLPSHTVTPGLEDREVNQEATDERNTCTADTEAIALANEQGLTTPVAEDEDPVTCTVQEEATATSPCQDIERLLRERPGGDLLADAYRDALVSVDDAADNQAIPDALAEAGIDGYTWGETAQEAGLNCEAHTSGAQVESEETEFVYSVGVGENRPCLGVAGCHQVNEETTVGNETEQRTEPLLANGCDIEHARVDCGEITVTNETKVDPFDPYNDALDTLVPEDGHVNTGETNATNQTVQRLPGVSAGLEISKASCTTPGLSGDDESGTLALVPSANVQLPLDPLPAGAHEHVEDGVETFNTASADTAQLVKDTWVPAQDTVVSQTESLWLSLVETVFPTTEGGSTDDAQCQGPGTQGPEVHDPDGVLSPGE